MSKITRERGSLAHDDRLDALEGAVRHWVTMLAIDQNAAVKRQREREHIEAMKDPLNHNRYGKGPAKGGSLFNKYLRR